MSRTDGSLLLGPEERELRSQLRPALWMLAWAASFSAVLVAIDRGWLDTGIPSIAATLLTSLIGIGMLMSHHRSLREADELRRRIEMDAMAWTLGVGLVGGVGYRLLESGGVVAEADFIHIFAAMCLAYSIAVVAGHWRYR